GVVSGPSAWPWVYGDAVTTDSTKNKSPRANVEMLYVRAVLMSRWVDGHFVNDWDPEAKPYLAIDDVPVSEQPVMLDQAALHFCLADAFHPGCEMTWPMRHATMYTAPFRIRHRDPNTPEHDYGPELTPKNVLQPDGPLYAQGPGDITRWMALPWQGDTAYCRSGYEYTYDPYVPTFWAARVPNQVLTNEDYDIVIDHEQPMENRIAAFNRRAQWLHVIPGYNERGAAAANKVMMEMIKDFGKLGIVEVRHHDEDSAAFPVTMMVETLPETHQAQLRTNRQRVSDAQSDSASGTRTAATDTAAEISAKERRLHKAGWVSAEQFEAFRKVRMGG
ncbi:MAG: LodA/GoxA family CTQ-dependent oxidase, partial [Chloroflexota bacterium]